MGQREEPAALTSNGEPLSKPGSLALACARLARELGIEANLLAWCQGGDAEGRHAFAGAGNPRD